MNENDSFQFKLEFYQSILTTSEKGNYRYFFGTNFGRLIIMGFRKKQLKKENFDVRLLTAHTKLSLM